MKTFLKEHMKCHISKHSIPRNNRDAKNGFVCDFPECRHKFVNKNELQNHIKYVHNRELTLITSEVNSDYKTIDSHNLKSSTLKDCSIDMDIQMPFQ